MLGWSDLHSRQLHRNFRVRRGNLFYPMRKEFHHQAETGEGTRQLDWDSAAIRRMNFGFAFPQARRAAPQRR